MGHFDQVIHRVRTMDMKDVSDLCLLGLLFDDMRTEEGVVQAVRGLDLGSWQPVREVIEEALMRLMKQGEVECFVSEAQSYYSISAKGIKRFFALIKRPLPYDMRMRSNSVALKSYFVETVPEGVRHCVVDELIGYYNCQLCALQDGCALCPLNSKRQEMFTERQMAEIKHEIKWLQGLT